MLILKSEKPRARFMKGKWFFRFGREWPGNESVLHPNLCEGWKCFMEAHGLYRGFY